MYKVILRLYIVSFNVASSEQCFVSAENSKYIPFTLEIGNDDDSIEEILQKIFESHISLGFGWVNTKLLDVDKNKDAILISYTCSIPPNTPLKNAYYISKNISIIDRLARKALYYV